MNHTLRTLACGLALLTAAPAVRAEDAPVLTLEQAKEQCKKNSYTLRSAQEKLVQASTLIDKAWVMVKPQLNAVGTYTHSAPDASLTFPNFNDIFDNITTDPAICTDPEHPICVDWTQVRTSTTEIVKKDSFGFAAQLSQPLFLARAYTSIKMANQAYELTKLSIDNLQDYLLDSLELAYLGALLAQKYQAIAAHAVEVRGEHLKVATAKFEVGDQPKLSVLAAEIDLKKAEQDVLTAANALAQTKEAIALLIGRADANFEIEKPALVERPTGTVEDIIQKALGNRRDLAIANLSLELNEKTKLDAWLRFAPSLFLTGMFRATDTKGFTGEYYSWNVGLTLSLPLYDGGLRYAYLDEAESKIRESQIAIEQIRASIASEIRQSWLKMERAEANLAKAREALTLAQEQVELAKVSFDAGAITSLEVTDANLGLFVSEVTVAQEEVNLELAIRALHKATRSFSPTSNASVGGSMSGGGESQGGSMGGMSTSGGMGM
ncbi:MAG TPA: TolC family protein [Myxococcota bacterium]|nr:TolC family protein [Myxococcota bacterium]HRY95301.1 TolC family protein [Myxococcota bacterium]HSA20874.1 TolC family protein [Myxococcota bacterium]